MLQYILAVYFIIARNIKKLLENIVLSGMDIRLNS